MTSPLRYGGIAAALVILGFGSFGLTQLASGQPSKRVTTKSAKRTNTSLGTYSVFSRPATPEDDVSGWPMRTENFDKLGLRLDQARVVYRDAVRTLAAVPATDGPCLLTRLRNHGGGLNCGGAGRVTVALGYLGAIGLVPDSVDTVTFRMTDGSTQTAKVVDNTWNSPAEAASATFVLQGDSVNIELMPRSSLPKGTTISDDGVVSGAG
jgi:hypothetical protein